MRGSDDFFMRTMQAFADRIGYHEDSNTQLGRQALERLLPASYYGGHGQLEVQDAMEWYNSAPESQKFHSLEAGDITQACVVWVGSRIVLARSFVAHDQWTEAADALEDAILFVRSHDECLESKELELMEEMKTDLRDFAGVPGLY